MANDILHRGEKSRAKDSNIATFLCLDFKDFFINKLAKIRENITHSLAILGPFSFSIASIAEVNSLDNFRPTDPEEVAMIINTMKCKNSPTDVIPTIVLKNCVDIFAHALSYLANLSFASGTFPKSFKLGHVIPLLKKKGSDEADPSSYRPITNLTTISKILEKLVLSRLRPHVHTSSNFSIHQSAYRPEHSTETALLKVTDDLNVAMDSKVCSTLLSLDISAAFDMIDIDKLVTRLDSVFGIRGSASSWILSYLSGRECYIALDGCRSPTWSTFCGVPQGSVLGPLLFSAFVSPISKIFEHFGIKHHQYADDTQMYTEIKSTTGPDARNLSECVDAVTHWFLSNGLLLNSNKTEFIVFGTRQQLAKFDTQSAMKIGVSDVHISSIIKTLGVQLDATLSMDSQVNSIVKSCNYHIRSLRHVRKSLTLDSTKTIASGLVLARLDYCNSLLYGTSDNNIIKLQRVQNNLARVVLELPWRSCLGESLKDLHWLPVSKRIDYKIALITFKTRCSNQPAYLRSMLVDRKHVLNLRSNDSLLLNIPRRGTAKARRGFSHAAPTVWNSLSLSVRQSISLGIFKKRLKTEFYRIAFGL